MHRFPSVRVCEQVCMRACEWERDQFNTMDMQDDLKNGNEITENKNRINKPDSWKINQY